MTINDMARDILDYMAVYNDADNWSMGGVFMAEHPDISDETAKALMNLAGRKPS